jgi:hypothetical protein
MSEDEPPEIALPTPTELKVEVAEADSQALQETWEKQFRAMSAAQEISWVRLNAIQDHYAHKGKWSYFLMGLMLLMVVFQSVLLGLVGANVWDFSKYDWLLPLLLVQNFASIVGLAVWVVKALFKDLK